MHTILEYGPYGLEYIVTAQRVRLFLGFLVFSMSFTPFAVFLEFYFARDELAILARPIIRTVALRTRESEKLIL